MAEKLSSGPKASYDLTRVGSGLSRGPNLQKKATADAWSNTWPAPGATLDLDFANNRGFVRGVGQGGAMDAVTFTRASDGTYVQKDGTIRPWANASLVNLLSFPQDFDNAVWTKYNSSSITANVAIAPDNSKTADVYTLANSTSYISQNASGIWPAGTYTQSIYVKQGNSPWMYFYTSDRGSNYAFVFINLLTGALGTVGTSGSFSGASASVTPADNGFFRLVLTFTKPATAAVDGCSFVPCLADNSFTRQGGDYVVAWGAQLELGSTATTYYPTNINAPRFDWASTAQLPKNLLLYSNDFTQSVWAKGAGNPTATLDALATSAGKLQKFVAGTANGRQALRYLIGSMPPPETFSFYVVAGEYSKIGVAPVQGAQITNIPDGWYDVYDVSSGVKTQTNSASGNVFSSTITSMGNGLYRITATSQSSIAGANDFALYIAIFNTTTSIFAGNGTNGIYVGLVQLEQSASATSYLQTGAFSPTNTPLAANPTCNGLLIEESRTNRLLWCRDATQTNWTKTNVTAAKNQTGIDGVANAASSLTASSANGTCIQTVTLASGSRTGSVYLKRITGTGTVQVSLDGSTWSTVDLSNGLWNRIVLSGTVTNPVVGILIATSGDAVAMDYGQIEDGTPVTTPILTTTATATRATEQSPYPAVITPSGVYDFLTRDRVQGVFANNQTVTTSRSITPNTGVRYVTRFIGFAVNKLKGNAKTIMGVAE